MSQPIADIAGDASTPLKAIGGAPWSAEQAHYLDGFFSGVKQTGLSFTAAGDQAGPPVEEDELIPEEASSARNTRSFPIIASSIPRGSSAHPPRGNPSL